MRIICPEKEFGKGCDIVVIENSRVSLIEVKSCKLSIHKASEALEQLDATEELLRQKLSSEGINVNDLRFIKIYLQDKRKGCKVFTQSKRYILPSEGVMVINNQDEEGKRLYNLYRKHCKD